MKLPPSELTPCRFGDGPAVAVFALSDGCACFPDDREQALCAQHALKASPIGAMTLTKDLTVGAAFAARWSER